MNLNQYKSYLSSHGRNEAEIKKNQSDYNIDKTFKRDPTYKRVYILTSEGWKFEDAKYQFHVANSILKDAVDYYLQFRPKIHYPVGSYVIIPDDTSFDINLTEEQLTNPFTQPVEERTQWWFIVGRTDSNAFVRYNIIKCNWNFKWVYKGKILESFGAIRNANSYTSGVWLDEISTQLDNITSAWLPDVVNIYGANNLSALNLDNNQSIIYGQRFMIGNSIFYPRCFYTTKVQDLIPKGVIKLTLKQDDFNENRDEPKYGVCDYYTEEGKIKVDIPSIEDSEKTSSIKWQFINSNNELIDNDGSYQEILQLGKPSYFSVVFSNDLINPEWKVEIIDDNLSIKEREYYNNLLSLTDFGNNILAIKPAKAKSLQGKHFTLSVSDIKGDYYSAIEIEVMS